MFLVRFSNEWCSWVVYDVLSGLKWNSSIWFASYIQLMLETRNYLFKNKWCKRKFVLTVAYTWTCRDRWYNDNMPCFYCYIMTCFKYLRVFNVHMEESCYGFIALEHKTVLFSFIAYLGGHGACIHHVLTMISRLLPLCSCSLLISITL